MSWDKIKELPFAQDIIDDLIGEVLVSVEKPTAHATHIAEGRRELALTLLTRIGEFK